jgi:hypothetical protein
MYLRSAFSSSASFLDSEWLTSNTLSFNSMPSVSLATTAAASRARADWLSANRETDLQLQAALANQQPLGGMREKR